MNDIIFNVLKAVLVLVLVIFSRYAVPWAKQILEDAKLSWIIKWVNIAVKSAEQTVLGNKQGVERKAVVTQFIKELLIKKNITLTDKQIDALIEAAVYALNGG